MAGERERVLGHRYVRLHADNHWDGVEDFASDAAANAELLAADVDAPATKIAHAK